MSRSSEIKAAVLRQLALSVLPLVTPTLRAVRRDAEGERRRAFRARPKERFAFF